MYDMMASNVYFWHTLNSYQGFMLKDILLMMGHSIGSKPFQLHVSVNQKFDWFEFQ